VLGLEDKASDNISAITRLYPAILAGDADTIRTVLAPDVVFREPEALPYGGAYHGPEGFLGLLRKLGEFWADMQPQEFRIAGTGNLVTAHFRFVAVSKRTGLRLDMPLIEAWDMESGQGRHGRVYYYDTFAARHILGFE
jgi:ketosteroid isomerase-like protein